MTADAGTPASSDQTRSPAAALPGAPPPNPLANDDAPRAHDDGPLTQDDGSLAHDEPDDPGAPESHGANGFDPDAARRPPDGASGVPGPPVGPGEPVVLTAHPQPLPVPGRSKRKSLARVVGEWVLVLGTALVAALLVQAFFLKAFFIPSGSMRPSLEVDDRVLVNKLSYRFGDVQRGDVIVFKKPDNAPPSDVDDFIKRAIAVGGDVIEARDGVVFVNGERIDEPYLAAGTTTGNLPRQTVPEGHVFVMGDNRNFSVDSRVFGPIDEGSIVGEALIRVWPPSKIGTV